MSHLTNHLIFLLITLPILLQTTHSVNFIVIDDTGNSIAGLQYSDQIGIDYSIQTLVSAADFVWEIFQQYNTSSRKNIQKVTLFIEDPDPDQGGGGNSGGAYYTENAEIHFNANYVRNYSGDDARREFSGAIYHETTHVWQWNGNGETPGGLMEGTADYVRLKANYELSDWVGPGEGKVWDQVCKRAELEVFVRAFVTSGSSSNLRKVRA